METARKFLSAMAGKGKKTKLRNTTRAVLETRLRTEGGCEMRVMELYLRLRHFTRSRRSRGRRAYRVCEARAYAITGRDVCSPTVGDKRPVRCVLSISFRLSADRRSYSSIVEVVPDDAEPGVSVEVNGRKSRSLLLRPGKEEFSAARRWTSVDQTLV